MTADRRELCQAIGENTLKYHSIIDKNGNYKRFGSVVRNLSGYTIGELEGTNLWSFIHQDDLEGILNQLDKLPAEKSVILDPYRFRLKSGCYKWIESTFTNMLCNKYVNGFLINSKDITKLIEAVNIRNKIVSSHSNFFAKHPFGVVHMSIDGMVDMINPKLIEDLGYRLRDINKNPLIHFFLPKHRRKVFQMFHNARKRGEAETFDVQVYTKRGDSLNVNLTIIPVAHDGEIIEIYGVIKDISDRISLQDDLKKISIVADKATNGVIIANGLGMMEWVNNGFYQMSGYTMEEAIGKYPGDILQSNPTTEIKEQITAHLSKGLSFTKELLCHRKDGTIYWNLVEVTPVLDEDKKLIRRISIHTDITERKKAEADLKLFADDLYTRNQELQQFGYVVSHNLRSPVANIMGITTLLEMEKDDPETVEQCTKGLKIAIHRLDEVIRDLSKILSITDGSVEITKENIDLAEILNNVKTDLRETIKHSGANIQMPVKSLPVFSHKAYLYSVFYNLVNNAIKYRSAEPPEIKISVVEEPESIIIQVEDNGIGIDLIKNKDDIFKPYKRFNVSVEGKGLGLFLVKSHVEALNGKVEIASEPGNGTTFKITLPAKTLVEGLLI
jgi:PAS domain S-box-containing protein